MRNWIDIALQEGFRIEPTRVSQGCPVFTPRNPSQFQNIVQRSVNKELRGMLMHETIHVWDAHYATHNAYENTFGDDGAIRLMMDLGGIEYNVMDFRDEQDRIMEPEAVEAILRANPILGRIYGPAISNIGIGGNDV